jgi:hypothetical protein
MSSSSDHDLIVIGGGNGLRCDRRLHQLVRQRDVVRERTVEIALCPARLALAWRRCHQTASQKVSLCGSLLAQPLDARQRPEIHEDDVTAQLGRTERL